MLKHIWSVICRKSIIDQDTNNLSLHEIVERFSIDIKTKKKLEEYNIPLEFEVVSFWTKNRPEQFRGEYKLEIYSPNGKKLGKTITNELIVPEKTKRIRTRLNVRGVVVNRSGDYQIMIYLVYDKKEKMVASIPLEIELNLTIDQSAKEPV